jgi:hypothetical protein
VDTPDGEQVEEAAAAHVEHVLAEQHLTQVDPLAAEPQQRHVGRLAVERASTRCPRH